MRRGDPTPRTRLSVDRSVWPGAERVGWPFGPFVKLLILTAQRRDEVAGLTRTELHEQGTEWHLPAARSKNGSSRIIPLSGSAQTVLKALPRIQGDLLLTTTGEGPIRGFSRAKVRPDNEIKAANGDKSLVARRSGPERRSSLVGPRSHQRDRQGVDARSVGLREDLHGHRPLRVRDDRPAVRGTTCHPTRWRPVRRPIRLRGLVQGKLGSEPDEHLPFAWIDDCPRLLNTEAVAQLVAVAKAAEHLRQVFDLPLAQIIVDTAAAAAGFGDENSAAEAQRVMNAMEALSRQTGEFVLGATTSARPPRPAPGAPR